MSDSHTNQVTLLRRRRFALSFMALADSGFTPGSALLLPA